jgi:hypothetical protein
MKRTLEKVKVTLNERDVLDAINSYVLVHHPDLEHECLEIEVAVTKGKYSAIAEVNRK